MGEKEHEEMDNVPEHGVNTEEEMDYPFEAGLDDV